MKILVSACLLGNNCKYDGGNNYHPQLALWLKQHQVFAVCPEIMGGLPCPRTPCEIVNDIVTDKNGVVKHYNFVYGAQQACNVAIQNEIKVAILQSRSPSCGCNQVYDGQFNGTLVNGMGVFAALLKNHGIALIDIGDWHPECLLTI